MKNVAPVAPHFGPASLDFHLNRPVISLIQLHIVPPTPSWPLIVAPIAPHLASARTAPEYKKTIYRRETAGCGIYSIA